MRQLTEEDASHYFTSLEQNLDLVNIKKDWKKNFSLNLNFSKIRNFFYF